MLGRLSRGAAVAAAAVSLIQFSAHGQSPATADAGAPFGKLPLIQEIDCSKAEPGFFDEFPKDASKVEGILGVQCRTLPSDSGDAKYFAYLVGKGCGLKAGGSYLLTVEFPEDKPRQMYICNWGNETSRGVYTGSTVGDVIKGRYTNSNPESLKIPLSGKYTTWRQVFCLHDRFPEIKRDRSRGPRPLTPADGFWVVIAQAATQNIFDSAGAAVAKIRLFEIPDLASFDLKINYPPDGLPRRHIFFREEMADGVISIGHKPEEKDPTLRGVAEPVDWYEYKLKLMRHLGLNTFCKDLLEFGHNQGWDSTKYGSNGWYNQAPNPKLWEEILDRIAAKYPEMYVLPYYEYAGSIGGDKSLAIGAQRRCETLKGGKDYTHISWCHKTNADLADPDFIGDAKKLIDCTVVDLKGKVKFIGAWFRPRPEANPISFNKKDLERFSKEAMGGQPVMRSSLENDKALLSKYYDWWFKKRAEFLMALRDYLREKVSPEAFMLYTCDSAEGGFSLGSEQLGKGKKNSWEWKSAVVTDDVPKWSAYLEGKEFFKYQKAFSYEQVVKEDLYLSAITGLGGTWGKWEWQHGCPGNDPENYRDKDGAMLSYSFNRLYTVASRKALEAFTAKSGLTIVRHFFLNENEMSIGKNELIGYFVSDVERSGPYSMMCEVVAMANGDPFNIGYLAGNNFNFGFPEHVRKFNAAFLSLPALPSKLVEGAASDPEIVVRMTATPKSGTYMSVVNIGWSPKKAVSIKLPAKGQVEDSATGAAVQTAGGSVVLDMGPAELRAFRIK